MRNNRFPVSTDKRFSKQRLKGDYGPKERWQHAGRVLEVTERAGIMAARAVDSDILDQLVLAKKIPEKLRDVGLRFRRDFHGAGLMAHVSASYNPVSSGFSFYGGWDERSEKEEEAYRKWREALASIAATHQDSVISTVCFEDRPTRAHLPHLLIGLISLFHYYEKDVL